MCIEFWETLWPRLVRQVCRPNILRWEFWTLYLFSHSAILSRPMFPDWGMESRQVMSPRNSLLPVHCTTASTRVLSKELSVKSFSSPSAPEEGPFTSSQGSPLRTVQLESENSFRQSDDNTAAFTHHLPPNGVCHTVFLLTSSHSTQRSKQIGGICTLHLPDRLMTHNFDYSIFTTTLHSFEARTRHFAAPTHKLWGLVRATACTFTLAIYFYFITS